MKAKRSLRRDLLVDASPDTKNLGAYYTDALVADFLALWAVRSPTDTVLDPCFGGGVFLRSACDRLIRLKGSPAGRVFGVEVDESVYLRVSRRIADEYALGSESFALSNFFDVEPTEARQVDAVIGNPPFIRYQRFNGEERRLGLSRSLAQGVRLRELSSSWAPFVVHCISMIRKGGRLAMVLPMEVGHAVYARPVLEHIRRSFGSATFLTFQEKLFPNLSEDTILLLADNKGAGDCQFLWRDVVNAELLSTIPEEEIWPIRDTSPLDALAISKGQARLAEQFISQKARELYSELKVSSLTQRLGGLARVGIGYVTGANDYFHLDAREAEERRISPEWLRPAVRRGRALTGLRFTRSDWIHADAICEAGYLLHIPKGARLPASVRQYLDEGEAKGVHRAYKCRTRTPWFSVPHVYQPDAFLTYMSGVTPRLVANDANAVAPNSLHILRLHPTAMISSDTIAALWQTSLTRLSAEIEGHALGGGMLKLEPTEAENVLVPRPARLDYPSLQSLAGEMDARIRTAGESAVTEYADELILQEMLGLSASDCQQLREAAHTLRSRRYRSIAK